MGIFILYVPQVIKLQKAFNSSTRKKTRKNPKIKSQKRINPGGFCQIEPVCRNPKTNVSSSRREQLDSGHEMCWCTFARRRCKKPDQSGCKLRANKFGAAASHCCWLQHNRLKTRANKQRETESNKKKAKKRGRRSIMKLAFTWAHGPPKFSRA